MKQDRYSRTPAEAKRPSPVTQILSAGLTALVALAACAGKTERTTRQQWPDGSQREERQQTLLLDSVWVDHGQFRQWYESGTLKQEGMYDSGAKSGVWTRWYDTSPPTKLSEGRFVDGEMDGVWKYWMNHAAHNPSQGDDSSEHSHTIHPDSQESGRTPHPAEPFKLESYHAGVPDGLWISWHTNGQVADSAFYLDGKLSGRVVSYYDNGALASEAVYNNGAETQPLKIWDSAGALIRAGG